MPSAEAVTSCRPAATGVPSASPVQAAAASAVTAPTISAEPAIGGSAARGARRGRRAAAPRANSPGCGTSVNEVLASVRSVPTVAGQAEAQPVLAGEGVADAAVAAGVVALDPGEERRGGRGVRQLAGERERRVGDRAAGPGLDDARRRGCRARGWPGRAGGGRGRAGRGRRRGRWRRRRRCRRPAGRWRASASRDGLGGRGQSPSMSRSTWRGSGIDCGTRRRATASWLPSASKTTALVTVSPLSIPRRLGMVARSRGRGGGRRRGAPRSRVSRSPSRRG